MEFPIVGIGASAGGLDAFKKFFSAMPADGGVAFVLIQHLDPTRHSLTADLVGTYTRMRVVQAEEGMRVEANRVYVIPPNEYLSIRARTLHLSPPTEPRGLRMAIDFFLRSLAADQHERAIGIVLSGTGTDGTLGLKEIKAAGGMTMAQDPATTQHDGMPRSAIASGSTDYILPAEELADALLGYVKQAYLTRTSSAPSPGKTPDPLASVVALLRFELRVRLQRLQDRDFASADRTPHEPEADRPHADIRRAAAERPDRARRVAKGPADQRDRLFPRSRRMADLAGAGDSAVGGREGYELTTARLGARLCHG